MRLEQHYLFYLCLLFTSQSNSLEITSPAQIKGVYYYIPANFGPSLNSLPSQPYEIAIAYPDLGACTALSANSTTGKVALIVRGNSQLIDTDTITEHSKIVETTTNRCLFTTKVKIAEEAGAIAAVIANNIGDHEIVPMYSHSSEGQHQNISIPSVSISHDTFGTIVRQIQQGRQVEVLLNNKGQVMVDSADQLLQRLLSATMATAFMLGCVSFIMVITLSFRSWWSKFKLFLEKRERKNKVDGIPTITFSAALVDSRDGQNQLQADDENCNAQIAMLVESDHEDKEKIELRNEIDESKTKLIPVAELTESPLLTTKNRVMHNETCNVCLEDFVIGETVKLLICKHGFHVNCIRDWLIIKGKCPVCMQSAFPSTTCNAST